MKLQLDVNSCCYRLPWNKHCDVFPWQHVFYILLYHEIIIRSFHHPIQFNLVLIYCSYQIVYSFFERPVTCYAMPQPFPTDEICINELLYKFICYETVEMFGYQWRLSPDAIEKILQVNLFSHSLLSES